MKQENSRSESLGDRAFAAAFSGLAAAATYAGWLFFHAGAWSDVQTQQLWHLGKWIVLVASIAGFLGGLDLIASFWGALWRESEDASNSWRGALVFVAAIGLAYAIYTYFGF